eukprot:c11615_g1_i1.p1 GENE.c11615_g1_i1~~c11615_g1_i1.p1  ORF type:complete len:200 (+),score=32.50 c11615_g1_i1:164-763(+)
MIGVSMLSSFDFVAAIHGYIGIFLTQALAFPTVLATRLVVGVNAASRVKEICMGQLLFVWMQAARCWDVTHETRWPRSTADLSHESLELYKGPFVVVANHVNFSDSILLTQLNLKKRYLTSSTYNSIPVFGWTQNLSGDIRVDLSSPESKSASLKECLRVLKNEECSVVIYPEGTRGSTSPTMLPFKSGAFRIAIEAGT